MNISDRTARNDYQREVGITRKNALGCCQKRTVKPLAVEMWIKGLNLAPKSKGHVRSVMHILFE
jgi:hypothetical protein